MKAKDLMIGDWIRKGDTFGQLFDIEQRKKYAIVGVELIGKGYDVYNEDEVEPIPLTPEILEKNGFRHGDGFEKRWYDVKIEDKKVALYRSNTFYTLKIDEGIWPKLNNIYIHFVHELQNALRLVGIEKEIKL